MNRRALAAAVVFALAAGSAGILWSRSPPSEAPSPPALAGAPATATRRAEAQAEPPSPAGDPALEPAGAPNKDGLLRASVSAGGRQVEGAEVHLYRRVTAPGSEPWQAVGTGLTDGGGVVSFPAPPGAYLVTASAAGLARGLAHVVRPAGEAVTTAELKLAPGSLVEGQTVDRRRGDPVPLATVVFTAVSGGARLRRAALPQAERALVTSDERGLFRLPSLAAGRYDVEASAPGHATTVRRDLAVPTSARLRLELGSAATIEGKVTRDGRPVSGAEVTVLGRGEPATAQSGERGTFAVEVEPGVHHLLAQLGSESGSAERPVEVAAGEVARGVEVRLGAGSALFGQVRGAGKPVAEAEVVASVLGDPRATHRTRTTADGSYQLSALPPSEYAVSVAASGFAAASVPGVHLRAGDRFRLDVALGVPVVVEGTVTDADGSPVGGALVTGTGFSLGGGRRGGQQGGPGLTSIAAVSDGAGRFRLEGVEPGRVRVSARKDASWAVEMVEVSEETGAHVDLTLVEGGLVGGVVRDPAGHGVAGASVAALPGGRPSRPGEANFTATDADGAYHLALPPGSYGLTALRPGSTFRRGRPPILGNVTVVANQPAQADLVLPDEPAATLSGHVVEPGGAPSGGAFLWLGYGPGLQATQADAEGAFSLSPAAGEEIQVTARNGGRSATLRVTPPAADVNVSLQPGATVSGTLVGDPAPETFALTVATRGMGPGGGAPQQQFSNATFELEDVLPGEVSLHVKTSDGRLGDAEVALAAGGSAHVDVALTPAATLVGRLLDASTGQPVARARILVDGNASRRGAVGADGRFSRTVSVGEHLVAIAALGYAPVTRQVQVQADVGADLGDLRLEVAGPRASP